MHVRLHTCTSVWAFMEDKCEDKTMNYPNLSSCCMHLTDKDPDVQGDEARLRSTRLRMYKVKE